MGYQQSVKLTVLSFNLENKTVKKKLTVGFSFIYFFGGGGGQFQCCFIVVVEISNTRITCSSNTKQILQ